MKRIQRIVLICSAAVAITASGMGQTPAGKKAFTFHGKVEGVNASAGTLKVNGDKVEGWMEAMTMEYKVADKSDLRKVKTGDEISATVYEGDMALHKVQVTKSDAKPK